MTFQDPGLTFDPKEPVIAVSCTPVLGCGKLCLQLVKIYFVHKCKCNTNAEIEVEYIYLNLDHMVASLHRLVGLQHKNRE